MENDIKMQDIVEKSLVSNNINIMSHRNATNIFIKLDFGMIGTLRICNSASEVSAVSYKYNLVKTVSESHAVEYENGGIRFFYTFADYEKLCKLIGERKQELIANSSESSYDYNMDLKLKAIRKGDTYWSKKSYIGNFQEKNVLF